MSPHRVSMLGSSLRRAEDPEKSRDPRVREVVASLRAVDYAPAPDPRFRSELRAQLVAVAPRLIAESAPDTAPTPVATARHREPARRRRFVRPLAVAGTVAAAFLVLLGGAVWMSQKALPGDSLYGLKRASENVQLSLTSGGTDKGHAYLSLAQTRVQEARALLRRDSASASGRGPLAGGLSAHSAGLISKNLASANSDLRHGSDLLNTKAVTSKSQTPLTIITDWAPGQLVRLKALADALPTSTVRSQTLSSWALTNSALTRARSLAPAVANGCASGARSDRLGPVPTCSSTGSAPATRAPTTRTPATPSTPATHSNRSGATHRGGSSGTGAPASGRPAAPQPTRSAPSSRGRGVPTLPRLLPSKAPISVGSCGISIGLGPIGVGVGGCPSHK
ncbi:DUF5667 domain-containing protein [uncultured Jatrophihabitans sp.]|uniref:DUF5667 domain-containing protein n=1 Tax=uncultured Jatrophihabitans sp. TaxID=1610747 RepID=UPI0035CC0CE3